MALTSGTVKVVFISNYAGPHRVCYRIGNTDPYVCVNVVCAGGGAQCEYDITVQVDNETCPVVSINGYVQPTCIDIASIDDRVAFDYEFTPSPTCLNYTATCETVGVSSFVINNPGSGYIVGAPPTIVVTGNATGAATVGAGAILTAVVSFASGGTGYTNGTYNNVPLLGGTGAGAQGSFTVVAGIVTAGLITSPGTGYTNNDLLSPDPVEMGPSTPLTSCTFEVTSDKGTIISITVTTVGSGYAAAPSVTIPPSGGITATASAELATCGELAVTGCTGIGGVIPTILNVGDQVAICKVGASPTPPAGFSMTLNGNCNCSCVNTVIGVSGTSGLFAYYYNKCSGEFVQGVLAVGGSPATINDCIVTGSLVTGNATGDAAPNIVYGASCP